MSLLVLTLALATSPADAPKPVVAPTFEVRENALRTADGSTRIPPKTADGSTRIPPKTADGSTRIPPKSQTADGSTRIPPKGVPG